MCRILDQSAVLSDNYNMRFKPLVYLCLVLPFTSFLYAQPVVLLAPEYPPFTPSGFRDGIWCELITAAFASQGLEVQWEIYPIARGNMMVRNAERLAIVNSEIAFAADLDTLVFFPTQPFFFVDVVAFYDSRRFPSGLSLREIQKLQNFRVGALRGTGSVQVLTNAGIELELSDSLESMARKLSAGRLDVMILGDLTGLQALSDYLPEQAPFFRFESVYQSPINLIFSVSYSNSRNIAEKYRAGMQAIQADGTYISIVKTYYPEGQLNALVLPPALRP